LTCFYRDFFSVDLVDKSRSTRGGAQLEKGSRRVHWIEPICSRGIKL